LQYAEVTPLFTRLIKSALSKNKKHLLELTMFGKILRAATALLLVSAAMGSSSLAIADQSNDKAPTLVKAGYMEATIDGEFKGWDGNTVIVLTNGQIWRQSRYYYEYHYAYRPQVKLIESDGEVLAIVEGMNEPVAVRRLK
jgi:hypothetical protein